MQQLVRQTVRQTALALPRSLLRSLPRRRPSAGASTAVWPPWSGRRFEHTPARAPSRWEARLSRLDSLFITGVTRFHEITGYSEIERLKSEVLALEQRIAAARELVRQTRDKYNETLANRASSQREMNELLLRKQAWQPGDLERFTELYKDDHKIEQDVKEAKAEYDAAEVHLEELQMQNGRLIGARYREEQLWSDKIRQASTWGTWILMGINIVLFVVVQLILEPWKRRRLVRSFEQKVQDMLVETEAVPQRETLASAAGGEDSEKNRGLAEHSTPLAPPAYSWSTLAQRLTEPEFVLRSVEAGALALGGVLVGSLVTLCLASR